MCDAPTRCKNGTHTCRSIHRYTAQYVLLSEHLNFTFEIGQSQEDRHGDVVCVKRTKRVRTFLNYQILHIYIHIHTHTRRFTHSLTHSQSTLMDRVLRLRKIQKKLFSNGCLLFEIVISVAE